MTAQRHVLVKGNRFSSLVLAEAEEIADVVNVRDSGAIGNGVNDDSAAFNSAATEAISEGKLLRVPPGTYGLQDTWTVNASGSGRDFEIQLDPGAKIVALAGMDASAKLINMTGATGRKIVWRGGYIDASAMPSSLPPGLANDALTISGDQIVVDDVELYAGTDWLAGGSDSGLMCVGGQISISNVSVQGFPDAGLYLGGGSAGGVNAKVADRIFLDNIICRNSRYCLTLKRRVQSIHVGRVQFEDSIFGLIVGVQASVEGGIENLEAHEISIDSVIARRVETALVLRYCDNAIVRSVISKAMGVKNLSAGGYSTTAAQALSLEGAKQCYVGGLVADGENSDLGGITSRAINAKSFTLEASTRHSTDNRVGPIIAANIDSIAVENDANQVRNGYDVAVKVNVASAGGFEYPPGVHVLGAGATPVVHTNVAGETVLATVTIPANAMGPTGRVRVTALYNYTNSANDKTIRIKFGGTSFVANVATTTASIRMQGEIANRNNTTNTQIGNTYQSQGGWGGTSGNPVTTSIDTTAAVDITLTAELEVTTETITLQSYLVELIIP